VIPATAPSRQTSPTTASQDSIVGRARVVLALATPTFREWTSDMFAPVHADTTAPTWRAAPLVGDFDGDGAPDVAFTGRDSAGVLILAVLSHRGQPIIAPVTTERELAVGIDLRRSRLALAVGDFQSRRREMIDVAVWDADGREMTLTARFIYEKGRFSVLVEGE